MEKRGEGKRKRGGRGRERRVEEEKVSEEKLKRERVESNSGFFSSPSLFHSYLREERRKSEREIERERREMELWLLNPESESPFPSHSSLFKKAAETCCVTVAEPEY